MDKNLFWKGKKVFVTGAGGFIGSHLVETLVSAGAVVKAFIRYNSRGDIGLLRYLPPEALAKIEIIAGDLRDPQAIQDAVKDEQIVYHLGALISIPYSYRHPYETAEVNLMGTLNILQASREYQIERLIHTSTSEVYGTAQQVPINESHPLKGQSPYSASKIGADKLAESYYCAFDLPVVTIRPFNTFGPRQSSRAVIPTIITQALSRKIIHLGNTQSTRDFTYIDDTVSGFLKAGETSSSEIYGKVFNLGTGKEILIGDVARMVIQKVDPNIEISVDENRLRPQNSEVFRLISDNALAGKSLEWHPEIEFEQGLDRTIDWIRDNLSNYQIGVYQF
jgi:dTDP-glucose 4,6-dehydratase